MFSGYSFRVWVSVFVDKCQQKATGETAGTDS